MYSCFPVCAVRLGASHHRHLAPVDNAHLSGGGFVQQSEITGRRQKVLIILMPGH